MKTRTLFNFMGDSRGKERGNITDCPLLNLRAHGISRLLVCLVALLHALYLLLPSHDIGCFLKKFHLAFLESSWFPREQVFMIFGHCQNHQNYTIKRPYEPKKIMI